MVSTNQLEEKVNLNCNFTVTNLEATKFNVTLGWDPRDKHLARGPQQSGKVSVND